MIAAMIASEGTGDGMNETTTTRVEIAGRAFLIYLSGELFNVLGVLTASEIAQLQQSTPVARTGHQRDPAAKLLH